MIYIGINQKKQLDGGGEQVKTLQVSELNTGKGTEVMIGHLVSIHYTAWRWDGRMFDSTYDHQKPLVFRVGEGKVFRGLEQGVLGMKVGGKRKLSIPPDMAAGVNGTGGSIPPNAALIYEIELLKIN